MKKTGILFTCLVFLPKSKSDCNYYQEMIIGQKYIVTNKEFVNKYSPGTNCEWHAVSPINSKIVLECSIDIPSSINCSQDRVVISRTGDPNFYDGHNYCGKGQLGLTSETNKMSIALRASPNSIGGTLNCSIVAVKDCEPNSVQPNCDCGWKQMKRIVGGVQTGIHEYPFMAMLVFVSPTGSEQHCGCTIIDTYYLVTAAHCVNINISKLVIAVGEHDMSTGSDTNNTVIYLLDKITVHPLYNNLTNDNDIAIIKTKTPMAFSLIIGPVCLPFSLKYKQVDNVDLTILGWGLTEFSGAKSDTLQAVNVTVVSKATCQARYSNNVINDGQVCTYAPGKDACQFDSGGPLIFYDCKSRRWVLIALVSFGKGCASTTPSVNTRITYYLDWIVQVCIGAVFCNK